MAQVDKLNYIPNLFWFILLFIFTYFVIFCYILPFLYSSLKTRNFYYHSLIRGLKNMNMFVLILNIFSNTPILNNFLKLLQSSSKDLCNFNSIIAFLKKLN